MSRYGTGQLRFSMPGTEDDLKEEIVSFSLEIVFYCFFTIYRKAPFFFPGTKSTSKNSKGI